MEKYKIVQLLHQSACLYNKITMGRTLLLILDLGFYKTRATHDYLQDDR